METVSEHPGHIVGCLAGRRYHHGHDQADDRSPRAAGAPHEKRRHHPSAGPDHVLLGARRTPTDDVRLWSRNEVMQPASSGQTAWIGHRRRFFVIIENNLIPLYRDDRWNEKNKYENSHILSWLWISNNIYIFFSFWRFSQNHLPVVNFNVWTTIKLPYKSHDHELPRHFKKWMRTDNWPAVKILNPYKRRWSVGTVLLCMSWHILYLYDNVILLLLFYIMVLGSYSLEITGRSTL